jgi:hypothetical protein
MLPSAFQRDGGRDARARASGNQRSAVRLIAQSGDYYAVTIEVRGPAGRTDISLRADQDLVLTVLLAAYCAAQARYDAYLISCGCSNAPSRSQTRDLAIGSCIRSSWCREACQSGTRR